VYTTLSLLGVGVGSPPV